MTKLVEHEVTDLRGDIKVGDTIWVRATGYVRIVRVSKITPTYIWVEYISPSTGRYHNTKFHR